MVAVAPDGLVEVGAGRLAVVLIIIAVVALAVVTLAVLLARIRCVRHRQIQVLDDREYGRREQRKHSHSDCADEQEGAPAES